MALSQETTHQARKDTSRAHKITHVRHAGFCIYRSFFNTNPININKAVNCYLLASDSEDKDDKFLCNVGTIYHSTRRPNSENHNPNFRSCKNLKSHRLRSEVVRALRSILSQQWNALHNRSSGALYDLRN